MSAGDDMTAGERAAFGPPFLHRRGLIFAEGRKGRVHALDVRGWGYLIGGGLGGLDLPIPEAEVVQDTFGDWVAEALNAQAARAAPPAPADDVVGKLVEALTDARQQLEDYERERSGESYNDPLINAALRLAKEQQR